MSFLNNRLGQIIAAITVASTLAGFGFEASKAFNRIENIESTIDGFSTSNSNQANNVADLEKKLLLIEDRFASLTIPDVSALLQDVAVLKEHKHPPQVIPPAPDLSGIKTAIEVLKTDIAALKNKKDNPLAN